MAGDAQSITLLNSHQEQGSPENLWRVQFAAKTHAAQYFKVMFTLITPDQEQGDMFKLMDRITAAGLNPGLPKVWIQATNIMAMQTSSDKWMLDSMDTLHARG